MTSAKIVQQQTVSPVLGYKCANFQISNTLMSGCVCVCVNGVGSNPLLLSGRTKCRNSRDWILLTLLLPHSIFLWVCYRVTTGNIFHGVSVRCCSEKTEDFGDIHGGGLFPHYVWLLPLFELCLSCWLCYF